MRLAAWFDRRYNMLLNLLRVENANPEYMITRSFYQYQNQLDAPKIKAECDRLRQEIDSITVFFSLSDRLTFRSKTKSWFRRSRRCGRRARRWRSRCARSRSLRSTCFPSSRTDVWSAFATARTISDGASSSASARTRTSKKGPPAAPSRRSTSWTRFSTLLFSPHCES